MCDVMFFLPPPLLYLLFVIFNLITFYLFGDEYLISRWRPNQPLSHTWYVDGDDVCRPVAVAVATVVCVYVCVRACVFRWCLSAVLVSTWRMIDGSSHRSDSLRTHQVHIFYLFLNLKYLFFILLSIKYTFGEFLRYFPEL